MSLDFGHIKHVMRDLDHKMLVVESDTTFMDAALFEPEGVVVLKGKGPSVENVAHYVFDARRRADSRSSIPAAASATGSKSPSRKPRTTCSSSSGTVTV